MDHPENTQVIKLMECAIQYSENKGCLFSEEVLALARAQEMRAETQSLLAELCESDSLSVDSINRYAESLQAQASQIKEETGLDVQLGEKALSENREAVISYKVILQLHALLYAVDFYKRHFALDTKKDDLNWIGQALDTKKDDLNWIGQAFKLLKERIILSVQYFEAFEIVENSIVDQAIALIPSDLKVSKSLLTNDFVSCQKNHLEGASATHEIDGLMRPSI